jgi:hypothetical protein
MWSTEVMMKNSEGICALLHPHVFISLLLKDVLCTWI